MQKGFVPFLLQCFLQTRRTKKNLIKMGGLSELTRQVRQHRQRAEQLQLANDKLASQLRVALELKNVSVADLASALRRACSAEVDTEMSRRVKELD